MDEDRRGATDAVLDGLKGLFSMEPETLRCGIHARGNVGIKLQIGTCQRPMGHIQSASHGIAVGCCVDEPTTGHHAGLKEFELLPMDAAPGHLLVAVQGGERLRDKPAHLFQMLRLRASAAAPLVGEADRFGRGNLETLAAHASAINLLIHH